MNKLDKYDFNIYVSNGIASLVAYKQRYQTLTINGEDKVAIETDTANHSVLPIPMVDEYSEEVAHLLDNEQWDLEDLDDWDEYDDWVGSTFLTRDGVPAMIVSFLDHLPDYELETK